MQRKPHFPPRLIAILLIGSLALLAGPLTAEASIWTLEVVSPDVEEMLASAETTASSSGSNSTPSAPYDERDDSQEDILTRLMAAYSSTGGSSSGTSSSGGANGSAPPALACDVSPTSDADVVASVCGERHLTLPSPPATDLLRPPCA